MKRPNKYSKPLEGPRNHYYLSDVNSQYAKDLEKYINHLEKEIQKLNDTIDILCNKVF